MEFVFENNGKRLKFFNNNEQCDEFNYIALKVEYSSFNIFTQNEMCVNSTFLNDFLKADIIKQKAVLEEYDSTTKFVFEYGEYSKLVGTWLEQGISQDAMVVKISGTISFPQEENECAKFSYFIVSKEEYEKFRKFISRLINDKI